MESAVSTAGAASSSDAPAIAATGAVVVSPATGAVVVSQTARMLPVLEKVPHVGRLVIETQCGSANSFILDKSLMFRQQLPVGNWRLEDVHGFLAAVDVGCVEGPLVTDDELCADHGDRDGECARPMPMLEEDPVDLCDDYLFPDSSKSPGMCHI